MAKVAKGEFGAKRKVSMRPEAAEVGYSGREYSVPSHDERGHGTKVSATVSPAMKRAMEVTVSKQIVPEFSTEGDLIRWCLYLGLGELDKRWKDRDLKQAHGMMKVWVEKYKRLYEERSWGDVFIPTNLAQLRSYIRKEHWIPAADLLRHIEEGLEWVTPLYWRHKIRHALVKPFQFVKAKAKVQDKQMRGEEVDS